METQSRISHSTQSTVPLALAAVLVLGGVGGYALRATTNEHVLRPATTEQSIGEHPALIQRSAREDDVATTLQIVPIPRSVREGDGKGGDANTSPVVPRSVREGDQPSGPNRSVP